MTPDNKTKLLQAFDALNAIASGGVLGPNPHPHSHGGSAVCDVCGHSLASGEPHTCPVGQALTELGRLIPYFDDRAAWLADPTKPAAWPTRYAGG